MIAVPSALIEALQSAPEYLVITAAAVTAIGVIWRKVFIPLRAWAHAFADWRAEVLDALRWVDQQTRTNGGQSLVDKVNTTADIVADLDRNVSLLLRHDAERDTAGHRYGGANNTNQEDTQ